RRILVRQLILAVLPSVRTDDDWHRKPARWASRRRLAASENHLLTHGAKHLHRKRFVTDDEIQPRLVGERRADDRLLVERGNYCAVDRFRHVRFRLGHSMPEVL